MKKIICFVLLLAMLVSVVGCGEKTQADNADLKEEASSCSHNYMAANCQQPKTCIYCGAKEGYKANHVYGAWTIKTEAIGDEYGQRERTCTGCGKKESEYYKNPHTHSWQNATCTSPKKCKTCGETDGTAKGHGFPNTDLKCKDCKKKVTALDYKYIAASDFRRIRNKYATATADYAIVQLGVIEIGDRKCACLISYIIYTIGTAQFKEVVLTNFTDNKYQVDPVGYYEDLADYHFGANKLMYMDVSIAVQRLIVDALQNGSTIDGDYLNL